MKGCYLEFDKLAVFGYTSKQIFNSIPKLILTRKNRFKALKP